MLNECQSNLVTGARTVAPAGTPTRATAPETTTVATPTPAKPAAPTAREVVRSTPSASPPSVADLSGLRDHNGNIIFCVMVNNDPALHFPQYAIDNGVRFPSLEGGNWKVSPTEYMEGDYGVTRDGLFFVSNYFLQSVLKKDPTNVKIKTTFEGWKGTDMSRVGDFWTIKGK